MIDLQNHLRGKPLFDPFDGKSTAPAAKDSSQPAKPLPPLSRAMGKKKSGESDGTDRIPNH